MIENTLSVDQQQYEQLINGLSDQQYGRCDSFFDQATLDGLRANLFRYFSKGEMMPAGVGKKFDYQKNAQIRGDLIKWIETSSENPFERIFLDKIERFIEYLNATCYTGINAFEFHYALYDVGSFYKRHLDQFKSDKGRLFSLVMYLNEDWTEGDGGRLSLYIGEEEVSIFPVEGRAVFFKSDETEHEVHPSQKRPRISIAGWLKKV